MTFICIELTDHLIMNQSLIFILLVGFFKPQAFAMPISVDNHPLEDSRNRYFLGISAPQDNENKAIKEAVENAYFDAITEVHGTEIEISQKSTTSMVDTNLSKVSILKTESIKFQKFEKIDQKVSVSNLQFIAKVLFRYDKSEIRKERERLKDAESLKKTETLKTELKPDLNQVGTSESILQLGRLEFRTFAHGKEVTEADIEIDQIKFASTPLLIGNRFSLGEHKIKIKHPFYEDYDGTFSVDGSDGQHIDINLRNACESITFDSSPSNAQVYIDGNLFGETPIRIETLSIEKAISIRIKLKGYYDQIFEGIVLHKNENLVLNPILNTKNIHENSGPTSAFDPDANVCSPSDLADPSFQNNTCEDRD